MSDTCERSRVTPTDSGVTTQDTPQNPGRKKRVVAHAQAGVTLPSMHTYTDLGYRGFVRQIVAFIWGAG